LSLDRSATDPVRPLCDREKASVAHVGDLVLLVLTTADDNALDFEELVPRVVSLVEDDRAFEVETETAGEDAFDALELFASTDYVAVATGAPRAELTERGEDAAAALVAGLSLHGQAALTEVTMT